MISGRKTHCSLLLVFLIRLEVLVFNFLCGPNIIIFAQKCIQCFNGVLSIHGFEVVITTLSDKPKILYIGINAKIWA
jgi:hypothetical protein